MRKTLTSETIDRFWYGYVIKSDAFNSIISYTTLDSPDYDIRTLINEAFHAGARWQLRETAKLSPYISRFLEMCILLGPDDPRDAWLEVTDVVPYNDAIDDAIDPDPVASAYPVERDLEDIPF